MSVPCTIPANPDVSGIGIRVGIYITSFLIALVPEVKNHYGFSQLKGALLQAAGLNGFALVITAVVQTAKHQLDLYHAIIVIHQLSFLGIATNPAGAYRANLGSFITYFSTMWLTSALFVAWWLYVWITAPHFGPPDMCNSSTIYVLIFVNVRAVAHWLRWGFVVLGAIMAAALVLIPVTTAPWVFAERKRRKIEEIEMEEARKKEEEEEEKARVAAAAAASAPRSGFRRSPPTQTELLSARIEESLHKFDPTSRSSSSSRVRSSYLSPQMAALSPETLKANKCVPGCPNLPVVDEALKSPAATPSKSSAASSMHSPAPSAIGESRDVTLGSSPGEKKSIFFRVLTLIYGTIMLELTVKRNHVGPGEDQWAFGQVVAVLIAIGGLNEVIHFFLGKEYMLFTQEDAEREEAEKAEEPKYKLWRPFGAPRPARPVSPATPLSPAADDSKTPIHGDAPIINVFGASA